MAKGSSRLASVDIFRGMTVALMIIVNTPGSWKYVWAPLRHSEWNGCTPTDMVFPFFLFIVGVSMWFSFKKYKQELSGGAVIRILRRTLLLFAVGLFLRLFPDFNADWSTIRIMGVIQRIALVYFLGSIICLSVNQKYLWIVVIVLLLGYWALFALLGGSDPYALKDNIVTKIDTLILGKSHLYTGYGIPFDPEGLVSTIPAIATALIGYYTGALLGSASASVQNALKLALIGIGMTGLGILWNMVLPINKPLWSGSYVLYTAGIAMIVLALLYMIADMWKIQKLWVFFTILGSNALVAYILAGMIAKLLLFFSVGTAKVTLYNWLYLKVFQPLTGNYWGSFLFALTVLLLVWLLTLPLYKKKIMIRA